jgi:hypothetical protein
MVRQQETGETREGTRPRGTSVTWQQHGMRPFLHTVTTSSEKVQANSFQQPVAVGCEMVPPVVCVYVHEHVRVRMRVNP